MRGQKKNVAAGSRLKVRRSRTVLVRNDENNGRSEEKEAGYEIGKWQLLCFLGSCPVGIPV